MSIRNACALILILASLACLYPGLMFAMLTIKVGTVLPFIGSLELYEATQSIVQTIENLFFNQNHLVAWLILIFSVVIPILKVVILLMVLLFLYGLFSDAFKWSSFSHFAWGFLLLYGLLCAFYSRNTAYCSAR